MDTAKQITFSDLEWVTGSNNQKIPLLVTDNGQFTVELLRQTNEAYRALDHRDRKKVKQMIREANRTGVAINE